MSLKELAAAAFAAVDIADDMVFDTEMKTTQALAKLRELKEYLDAAPKTAAELVAGCGDHYACYSQLYVFTRSKLEDFAQTAFAAGCAHGYASTAPREVGKSPALGAGYGINPVHDYSGPYETAPSLQGAAGQANSANCCGPQQPPAATPIRTSEAAVDLQFSDGTCVNVRVAGK